MWRDLPAKNCIFTLASKTTQINVRIHLREVWIDLTLKVWLLSIRDKELRLVLIWTRVCHSHHASVIELWNPVNTGLRVSACAYFDGRLDLISKWPSPYGVSTFACSRWITCLDHEALDIPNAIVFGVAWAEGWVKDDLEEFEEDLPMKETAVIVIACT